MRDSWYFASAAAAKPGQRESILISAEVSQGLGYSLAIAREVASNRLVNGPVEDGGDLAHFVGEDDEFLGEEGLHAIGEGFLRLVMNFNEEAISANGDSSSGEWQHFVALAGAVSGIDENGQVTAFFDGGDDGEVKGIARKIGEGAHTALAEHHVVIALGEDVLGGHEEFVERGGHPALEENGFLGAAGAFQK